MSLSEVVVDGTITPDGKLELSKKPEIPPGPVTVVIRQVPTVTTPEVGWWPLMQEIRKKMEEAGCHFMDEKEMNAHIDWLREEDRIDVMLRELDEQRRNSEKS